MAVRHARALLLATTLVALGVPPTVGLAAVVPPPLDVRQFGAVPNDAGNDTDAFRRALAAAAAPGSPTRVVTAAPGVYSVRPDAVTVAGAVLRGPGATLSARDHGTTLLSLATGGELDRIAVDGRDRVVRGVTITAGSRGVRLRGATVRNVASPVDASTSAYAARARQAVVGVLVDGDSDDVVLDRLTVEDVRAAVPVAPSLTAVGGLEGPAALEGWRHEHASVAGPDGAARWVPHAWSVGGEGAPSRAGQRAVRFELRRTDAMVNAGMRSEFSRAPEPTAITDDRWYGFSVLLPRGGTDDHGNDPSPEIVGQWHNTPDRDAAGREESVSPPLALQTRNGQWELVHLWDDARLSRNGDIERAGRVTRKVVGPYAADKGRWTDWAFRVRWDHRPDAAGGSGLLEVYKDRRLVHTHDGPIGTDDALAGPYFKWGLYKWDWNPGRTPDTVSRSTRRVVHLDEFRAAGPDGSVAAVSPPRWPESPDLVHGRDSDVLSARGVLVTAGPGQRMPTRVVLSGSTIRRIGPSQDGHGIVVSGDPAAVAGDAGLTVTGTTFSRIGGRAVELRWPGATVSRNRFESSGERDDPYGVRPRELLGHDALGAVAVLAPRVSVVGNTLTGPGAVHSAVEIAGDADSDVMISGNSFANGSPARAAGSVLVRVERAVQRLTVSGNVLRTADVGVGCAVRLTTPVFAGNRVSGVPTPADGCAQHVASVSSAGPLRPAGGSSVTVTGHGFGVDAAAFRARGWTATVAGRPAGLVWLGDSALRVVVPAGAPGTSPALVLLRGGLTVGTGTAGTYA